MKGMEFAIVRYGSIWNDPAFNVAVPNPSTASNPVVQSVFSEFPASFILIRHPQEGLILYDVGDFPEGEDGLPRPSYWKEYFKPDMAREDFVDRILPRHGVSLEDISSIILSHMHYDHAGGLKFFAGTKAAENVYVPKEDFLYGCLQTMAEDRETETTSPYWRSIMTTRGIRYHFIEKDTELFPGVHLFLLGGHTPAVAALLLELENKNYLFPSDACSSQLNYGPPMKPTSIMYDSRAFEESVKKLYELQKEYDAELIFSHDLEADAGYRHFPEFYK